MKSPASFLQRALAAWTLGCALFATGMAQTTPAAAVRQSLPKSSDYVSANGLSIDELLHRMRANNLDLQAARQRLTQAEGRLQQSALRPNPTLDYQFLSDKFTGNNGDREEEFTLNQPFDFGRKRRLRLAAAQAEVERIRLEIAVIERDKFNELETLLAQALQEAAQLFASERIYELNEAMRAATELRVNVGDASRYEANQTAAELLRLQAEMIRSASKLDGLLLQIKTLAGIPGDEALTLRDDFNDFKNVTYSFADAVQMAFAARPDLLAAKQAEREATAKINLAQTGKLPDMGAIFGYKRTFTVSPAPLPATDWQVKAGVSITLPLFNRQQGLLQEASAALAEARLHRASLEQLIRRDVLTAMQHLQQAARNLTLHEEKILPLAQENARMAKLGFDMGEIRMLDYINEQRRLAEAQTSAAQAKGEWLQARIELERAIGKRLP